MKTNNKLTNSIFFSHYFLQPTNMKLTLNSGNETKPKTNTGKFICVSFLLGVSPNKAKSVSLGGGQSI